MPSFCAEFLLTDPVRETNLRLISRSAFPSRPTNDQSRIKTFLTSFFGLHSNVPGLLSMKRERNPTRDEFEKLLLWFNPDPDEAGTKFDHIHSRLTKIFTSRGCVDAETLADEVLNRVAVRINTVVQNYSDPLRCCIGFVDHVYREYAREQQKQAAAKDSTLPRPSEELEQEDGCLKECLAELLQPQRELVMRYFQGEKSAKIAARKKLAAELHLTANALRIQAHRHRQKLRQCIQMCLERT
jgi:DNA-directed RNA polymerase specialized sigma24 family protein